MGIKVVIHVFEFPNMWRRYDVSEEAGEILVSMSANGRTLPS